MTPEEQKELAGSIVKNVEESLGVAIESEVKKALEGNTDLATTKSVEEAAALIKEVREEVLQLKDGVSANGKKETLVSFIKENKEQLKAMSKGKPGEMTVKADLVRAGIATNPWDLDIPGIGQLDRDLPGAYNLFAKVPVGAGSHNGTIAYVDWDGATTVAAAAAAAENTAFAESTAVFVGATEPIQKIGDSLPVSEEFFEDEVQAAAELALFLSTNVMDVVNDQIIAGTGVAPQLNSLTSRSTAYAPAASGIADANIFDLIVKMSEAITSVGGNKYRPDFALMNIADINLLRLKKDADNNYTFPFGQSGVGSIRIVEDNSVAANTCFVGDSRFARIYEMGGVDLSVGYSGTDYVDDLTRLKARKRLAFLIRNADQTGFMYSDSISADLTTLAT